MDVKRQQQASEHDYHGLQEREHEGGAKEFQDKTIHMIGHLANIREQSRPSFLLV